MAKSSIDIKKLEDAANRLRVLSHPMRIAIIELLSVTNKMNVTEIYSKLKIEQAAASHHLSMLKNKGMLKSKREGRNTYYFLKQEALKQIIDCIKKCRG